jgi:hypothetical protein
MLRVKNRKFLVRGLASRGEALYSQTILLPNHLSCLFSQTKQAGELRLRILKTLKLQ